MTDFAYPQQPYQGLGIESVGNTDELKTYNVDATHLKNTAAMTDFEQECEHGNVLIDYCYWCDDDLSNTPEKLKTLSEYLYGPKTEADKLKPPTASDFIRVYPSSGKNTEPDAEFVAFLEKTAEKVNKWPEWKRNMIGSYERPVKTDGVIKPIDLVELIHPKPSIGKEAADKAIKTITGTKTFPVPDTVPWLPIEQIGEVFPDWERSLERRLVKITTKGFWLPALYLKESESNFEGWYSDGHIRRYPTHFAAVILGDA